MSSHRQSELEEQVLALKVELALLDDRYKCNTAIMHARTRSLAASTKRLEKMKAEVATLKDHMAKSRKACDAAKVVLDSLNETWTDVTIQRAKRMVGAVCSGVFDRDCDPDQAGVSNG